MPTVNSAAPWRRRARAGAARGSRRLGLRALVVLLAAANGAAARGQTAWERTPYRVTCVVAFDCKTAFGSESVARFAAALQQRVDSMVGGAWDFTASTASAPQAARLGSALCSPSPAAAQPAPQPGAPAWLDDSPVPEASGSDAPDKVLGLYVERGRSGLRLAVQEYDVRTQLLGPRLQEDFIHPQLLLSAAVDALFRAFRPLAVVERVTGRDVLLRVRAAALPLRDAELDLLHPRGLLQAVVRYNHRDGSPQHLEVVPWTYLLREPERDESPSLVQCRIHSALQAPLTPRRRGRVEMLAVALDPPRGTTRLELYSRTRPDKPLVGYAVYAYGPDAPQTELLGYTDAQGGLTIPPGDHRLRLLLIRNGHEILARLPLVPGLSPTLRAPLRDDDVRLAAEGFVQGLQYELVDTVVRRQVLLRLLENDLDQRQWDAARQRMQQIDQLPTAADYRARLSGLESRTFADDAVTRQRIARLFDDTRALLDRFLDPAPVEALRARLIQQGAQRP
jgi:hypothetical protein